MSTGVLGKIHVSIGLIIFLITELLQRANMEPVDVRSGGELVAPFAKTKNVSLEKLWNPLIPRNMKNNFCS